jgi:hypothetical protein
VKIRAFEERAVMQKVVLSCDLEISPKGSFTNYVDKILAFFHHLPPCVDIFYGMNVDKKTNISEPPTYLPSLVNVVCERPLSSQALLGLLGILKRQGKIVMVFTCTSGRVERHREGRGEA